MAYFHTRLFLYYLALTIAIETPVLYLVIRRVMAISPSVVSGRVILGTGIVASFCTYPYLWYVVPEIIVDRQTGLIFGETAVIFIESFLLLALLRITYLKALTASIICNSASIILGTILNKLIVQYHLLERFHLI